MNDDSQKGEQGNQASENLGCVATALVILWVIVTIALFPSAREIRITPWPNVNGLLISTLILIIGIILSIILFSIRGAIGDTLRLVVILLIVLILAAALFWFGRSILNWLFTPY